MLKKNTSKLPENRRRVFSRRITKIRKRATRGGPQGAQAATWRGPHPGRAGRAPGAPGPLQAPPSGLYTPRHPKTLKKRVLTEFRRRSVAETYREEKAISGGQIPPGRSPPGRGDHRHRHHHRHGHHRDHHQHHPQHQHHLHLHLNLISQLQLVL